MSDSQSDFLNFNLSKLDYSSKKDIIENLFIKSLVDNYNRVDKNIGVENEIRDRIVRDLYSVDSDIKKWLQLKIIYLDWENWVFTPEFELGRTDIVFKLTGLQFIIECKRVRDSSNAYISEGLERFISLKYAQGDEFAGMLGFTIAGDKVEICKELKGKIDILSHTISTSDIFFSSSFNSNHNRIDQTQIEIYHLFFDFNLLAG